MQDTQLLETLAHFSRERIPERCERRSPENNLMQRTNLFTNHELAKIAWYTPRLQGMSYTRIDASAAANRISEPTANSKLRTIAPILLLQASSTKLARKPRHCFESLLSAPNVDLPILFAMSTDGA